MDLSNRWQIFELVHWAHRSGNLVVTQVRIRVRFPYGPLTIEIWRIGWMVTIPACHAVWYGFESRMCRKFGLIVITASTTALHAVGLGSIPNRSTNELNVHFSSWNVKCLWNTDWQSLGSKHKVLMISQRWGNNLGMCAQWRRQRTVNPLRKIHRRFDSCQPHALNIMVRQHRVPMQNAAWFLRIHSVNRIIVGSGSTLRQTSMLHVCNYSQLRMALGTDWLSHRPFKAGYRVRIPTWLQNNNGWPRRRTGKVTTLSR